MGRLSHPIYNHPNGVILISRSLKSCDEVHVDYLPLPHRQSEAFGQCNVLRLVVRNSGDDLHAPELEIYTLGDDEKWRNMGQVSCHLWYHFGNVNVNGSLHWIDGENLMSLASISSFNIGTEEVNPLLAPPGLKTTSFGLTLVELGNCLYFSENCTSH
ncbi:hypothetical protein T459_27688 [Capsicum annuum]|uniref:F-box associated beta-propeller type 1 domain-containing protein n=1 Tax=Capsicum annuum TaxID=4072 RepID=A0A2G2YF50_CAPAN|nr:hypothetical protein T459_27688 [Capsicum annuum]